MDYGDVVVCAPVTVPYVRRSDKGAAWWLGSALRKLLETSGLAKQQIDGLCLSSFTLAPDGPAPFTQYVGLVAALPGVPADRWRLRRHGAAPRRSGGAVRRRRGGGLHRRRHQRRRTASTTWSRSSAASRATTSGHMAPADRTQSFALLTDHAMRRTGATREDFGKLCVAQRQWAQRNPLALLRGELTLEAYLAARPIALPLHLFDCVMPCAGADGFLVMHRARAAALGLPCVRILATIERHNAFPDDPIQWRGGWAMDADALWQQAAIGPDAIDVLQTYDDYPVISMLQFEDLGFCAKDAGADFIRRNEFGPGGNLPHNTGGGQLSGGQAGAAGGFLGLVEAMRQLTGQAERAAGARRAPCPGQRLRHDQLRSRPVHRRRGAGGMIRCSACRHAARANWRCTLHFMRHGAVSTARTLRRMPGRHAGMAR